MMTRPIKAWLLSWMWPGFGHLFLRQWTSAVAVLALSAGVWYCLVENLPEARAYVKAAKAKYLSKLTPDASSNLDAAPIPKELPSFPLMALVFVMADLATRFASARHAAHNAHPPRKTSYESRMIDYSKLSSD